MLEGSLGCPPCADGPEGLTRQRRDFSAWGGWYESYDYSSSVRGCLQLSAACLLGLLCDYIR
jgi:hypothetical protein